MANGKPMTASVAVNIKPLAKTGADLACSIVGSAVDGGILQLSKGKAHEITFHLVSGGVHGLSFLDSSSDPFCSTTDAACPAAGDTTSQFPSGCARVTNGNKLIVEAGPGTDDVVHYAIQFTDGTNVLSWDPIIVNG